jgi:type II secretory pathway pseudopilin PulG
MTLIEVMISMTIMMAAVTAAAAVFIAGSKMTAETERRGTAEDAARMAMDAIAHSAQNSALGIPGGLWVNWDNGGTKPTLVNPVFGGNDDLWVVVPDRNAFRESCVQRGAYTTTYTAGTGPLTVRCVDSFAADDMLVATNFTTGALLTHITLVPGPPATIGYAESGSSYSDAPGSGGFTPGDVVFKVRLLHYFIDAHPITGRPALWMADGEVDSGGALRPFKNSSKRVVQDNIESLRIRYCSVANPGASPDCLYQNAVAAPYAAGLHALGVTVVATTTLPRRQNGSYVDYERINYERLIELPNMATGFL